MLLLGGASGATLGLAAAAICAAGTEGVCLLAGPQAVVMGAAGGTILAGAASTLEDLGVLDLEGARTQGVHAMGALGRWVRRTVGGALVTIGVYSPTPTTDSATGDVPGTRPEAQAQGRQARKNKEEDEDPGSNDN